ncbi:uncharacterized protein BX664DRAFT_336995 [Halteromyces radiatus]|uniref:uncharacterized protein n=1 Tax=Halteromyces radiatus TaxID=101107 RepID=UPI00221EFB88|nr:uncharacterized protein BX664DRAFT_336995 [Halteromyces radiatus]KAI8084439.1 hypothetical protein BX664DRAFT_336995 [Halteromyces radiatus]
MSSGDSYTQRETGSKNVSDLASSFLHSMGQELIHSSNDSSYYHEKDAQFAREDYEHHQRRRERLDDGYREHNNSSSAYDDRTRDRERRSRRERSKERQRSRERSHHPSHRDRRSDREYRRSHSRRSVSPRERSRGSSRRHDETTVIPLHKRPRRLNNWDVAPPGMENMTATQVKQTGLFPLPGQVVGTKTPQSFAPPSEHPYLTENPPRQYNHRTSGQDFSSPATVTPPISSAARQARRLYVGQIPYAIDEQSTSNFFNEAMKQMKGSDESFVSSVQINRDKNYAFVEFKTPEQATMAMAFDGIQFQGQILKIRRPKDYQPPADGSGDYTGPTYTQAHGLASVPDSPDKIFIGGLPTYLTDDQVVELLKSFGELKAFNLVKDTNGQSKGYAFCEYADVSITDLACQGLNNMELGEKKLIVQRASVGAKNGGSSGMNTLSGGTGSNSVAIESRSMMTDIPFTGAKDDDATRVLQLMNMVVPEELEDDEEYQDIWQDIAEECAKFGVIVDMKIPRPAKDQQVPGCGSIFVRFETKEQTVTALQSLAGRKFADRIVVASYIDEDKYLSDYF